MPRHLLYLALLLLPTSCQPHIEHAPRHHGEHKLVQLLMHGRLLLCSGQGGDHDIAKDCTAQFVEGWDWIVPVPDRNTGIWDDVTISWTGPVRLQVLLMTRLTQALGTDHSPRCSSMPAAGFSEMHAVVFPSA